MNPAIETAFVFGFVAGALVVAVPVSLALRAAASRYVAETAKATMAVRMRELAVEALDRVRDIAVRKDEVRP